MYAVYYVRINLLMNEYIVPIEFKSQCDLLHCFKPSKEPELGFKTCYIYPQDSGYKKLIKHCILMRFL